MYEQIKVGSYSGSVVTTDVDGTHSVVLMIGPCCVGMSPAEAETLAATLKKAIATIAATAQKVAA